MSVDFGAEQSRRLPVYLLLDCSASMAGAPIQAVNEGMSLLHTELLGTPQALETVWVAAIAFASDAKEVVPLTEVENFAPPKLEARGTTSLGTALKLLGELLDKDTIVGSEQRRGDWKPLVFLLTDGEPTDEWQDAAKAILNRAQKPIGTLVALGCGEKVNAKTLKQLTDNVLLMQDVTREALQAFFKWVSATVSTASVSAMAASHVGKEFPPLPAGLTTVESETAPDSQTASHQI